MIKIQEEETELFAWHPARPSRLVGVAGLSVALVLGCGVLGCSTQVEGVQLDDGRTLITVERPLMGTHFRIDALVEDEAHGRAAIAAAFAEVSRSEEVLSNWSETSQISEVNRAAGTAPLLVSHELLAVLERAFFSPSSQAALLT